jgi:hypothetical protein
MPTMVSVALWKVNSIPGRAALPVGFVEELPLGKMRGGVKTKLSVFDVVLLVVVVVVPVVVVLVAGESVIVPEQFRFTVYVPIYWKFPSGEPDATIC